MMSLTAFLIAVLVFSSSVNAKAPLLASDSDTIIKNEYIVVMNEDLSDKEIESHKNTVRTAARLQGNFSSILFEYNIGKGFRGYGIFADDKMVDALRTMNGVKYIEHNQEMHALDCKDTSCVCQDTAVWGLHRTIYKGTGQESEYFAYDADAAGLGVDVYILDTGIKLDNIEFDGRAEWGNSFITPKEYTDGNGHGTHVAGTVIGETYGLARKAKAIAVQVLGASGSGSTMGVISGVDYTANAAGKKKIANMSLGGGKSTSLNSAVDNAIKKGVHFAVAAGNEDQDACNVSPASVDTCVTVASIQKEKEQRSSFSNYGKCVDIFAPGSSIKSAWIGSQDATNTISGTSMASPHVAGVMAMILSSQDLTPAEMKDLLIEQATPGIVANPGMGSPNLLLYNGCY